MVLQKLVSKLSNACRAKRTTNEDGTFVRTRGSASEPLQSKISLKKRNLLVDSQWAEKQSHAFVGILNYYLSDRSDEFSIGVYGTLLYHQRQNRNRHLAKRLYNGDIMLTIRNRIESEIKKEKISIRIDRDLYADLSLRRQITDLILSYNHSWLHLGLETVFNEVIDVEPVGKRKGLRQFILSRVLADPAILFKYTRGRCKLPSGKFEKRFRSELRQHSLRVILLLVLFLDMAKAESVIDCPCLFHVTSPVKSSRDVLVEFCRHCLSGEGNFIRHLSHIGVSVTYCQDKIDEYNFSVNNLAIDLRDGIRLGRFIEILSGDHFLSILAHMRLPTVSRLQKIHNVSIVIDYLKRLQVPNLSDIQPKHVVDGHQNKVLKLMWIIISHFEFASLLDEDMLEQEIICLQRQLKRQRYSCQSRFLLRDSLGYEDKRVDLLLKWSQIICSSYGHSINNFSSSFADGKALCYLISFYHPKTLPLSSVRQTSSDGLNLDEAVANEQANIELANQCMADFGGIPNMLPLFDSQNQPEERSMITSIAFLCSRLMASSQQIRATMVIQRNYKIYSNNKMIFRKKQAAQVIISFWRKFKDSHFQRRRNKYLPSVKIIEKKLYEKKFKLSLMKSARLNKLKLNDSAVTIQCAYRLYISRSLFNRKLLAIQTFQLLWKSYQARKSLNATVKVSFVQA